jgi:hypothetical protein
MRNELHIFIKLCVVLLIIAIPISLSAQYYSNLFINVEDFSKMTEPQLELALDKSLKTIETGKSITVAGGVGTLIGGIMYFVGLNGITSGNYDDLSRNTNIALGGSLLASAGISAASVGVALWFLGNKRKDDIEIALVKFRPISYNDNSGYGIGIHIPF